MLSPDECMIVSIYGHDSVQLIPACPGLFRGSTYGAGGLYLTCANDSVLLPGTAFRHGLSSSAKFQGVSKKNTQKNEK